MKEPNIDSIVSVGHDGSVYRVHSLDDKFDIDTFYKKAYNEYKLISNDDILAEKHATDTLYDLGVFKCDRR